MKLRIKGNSIRLRLTRDEVYELVHQGEVMETCVVLNKKFIYGVKQTVSANLRAVIEDNEIIVFIPMLKLEDWDENELVGFTETTIEGLTLIVEKDFKCLEERESEDESKLYPNPNAKI